MPKAPSELPRVLNASHATSIVVGIIIGSGIFLVPREMMAAVGSSSGVYTVWIVLTILIFPMYMFSPKELAPNEDQGVVFGIVHALFYGAQGTLYSSLYPTGTRYTGLSFVYQFSGIYASGVTPMILTALIAAAGGTPWVACAYLVATAVISVVATALIREQDLHFELTDRRVPCRG